MNVGPRVLCLSGTGSTKGDTPAEIVHCTTATILLKKLLCFSKQWKADGDSSETEINFPVVVLIDTKWAPTGHGLEALDVMNLVKLLKFRFYALNLLVKVMDLTGVDWSMIGEDRDVKRVRENTHWRLLRIKSWIGLLPKSNAPFINTMPNYLNNVRLMTSPALIPEDVEMFTELLVEAVEYEELLEIPHEDAYYVDKINRWDFNAYEFSSDELVRIGAIILSSTKYEGAITGDVLLSFLFFVRDNYHVGNPFHNFRHAIDVLQATNFYLSQIDNENYNIRPIDSYSLLLASLGHDIGHPGITNVFLINYSTPLAVYYENISVLEQFHHFQFEQIRRPYFSYAKNGDGDRITDLIHASILATDMARHDSFVEKIPSLDKQSASFELLACLLIKSADISNVCRPLSASCKWGLSLGEEFKQVAKLEYSIKKCHSANDDNWDCTPCECGAQSKEGCNGKSPLDSDESLNGLGSSIGRFPIREIEVEQSVELVPGLRGSQLFFIDRFATNFFVKIGQAIEELDFLNHQLKSNARYWKGETR